MKAKASRRASKASVSAAAPVRQGIEFERRESPTPPTYAGHAASFFHRVAEGAIDLVTPSGNIHLGAGALILTPGGVPYRLVTGRGGWSVIDTLRVRASAFALSVPADADAWWVLMDLKRRALLCGPQLAFEPSTGECIAELFTRMHGAAARPLAQRRMRLKAATFELLAVLGPDPVLVESPPTAAAAPPLPARLRALLWHMETHFTDDCAVPRLADRMGLKPSQFHALFKHHTGQTPNQYLMRLRIGHACRLLTETDIGVLEVADACGYHSLSQFYAAFRKVMCCTPGDLRRRMPDS